MTTPNTATATPARKVSLTGMVTAGALIAGALFVLIGNFFEEDSDSQNLAWSVGATAIAVGALLLAVRMVAGGRALEATGLSLLAIANIALLAGPRASAGSDQVLGQLALAMGVGLLLVAIGGWGLIWARAAAAVSGLAFTLLGITTAAGTAPNDLEWAVAIGYVALVVALAGWAMDVYKNDHVKT